MNIHIFAYVIENLVLPMKNKVQQRIVHLIAIHLCKFVVVT